MRYIFRTFYQIFNRHQKIRMCILLCMMIVGAIFETVGVSLIFPFVSLVLDPESVFSNEIMYSIYNMLGMKSSSNFLIAIGIGLIGIFVIKDVYLYFMYSIQYRFASNNKLQMSSKLFSIYLNKPYEFYLSTNASEIIGNVNTDVANVFTLLTTVLQMMTEIITALGLIVVLMVIDFQMTLFVTILLIMATAAMKYIFKPIQQITGVKARNSDTEIIKWLNQSIHGIKEVKVTESEAFFLENYYKSGLVSAEASRKFNVINTIPQLFMELVFMVGIICYIIFLLLSGKEVSNLVPQISAFAMAAIRLLPIANKLNRHLGTIAYSMPSLESVKQLLSDERNPGSAPEGTQHRAHHAEEKLTNEIRFDNVSFRYDNSSKWILERASLCIPIGKTVGIIGPSGSGKTTLIDLLLGLLEPACGRITADGESILDDPESWLHRIGYVSQSMYLTEDSIRKNIAFGQDDEQIDDKKIETILHLVCLDDFISALPDGIETQVGEFGTKLSGGQKQRVCIARALYYDPEILILDEATSALDLDTEKAIMENIIRLKGKITMIIIAHRLQTIKDCDAVYMVKEGKIERKTHQKPSLRRNRK